MVYKIISYIFILGITIYCFISDFNHLIVENKVLIIGSLIGLILNLSFGLVSYLPQVKNYLIGIGLTTITSLFFYFVDIYSAGDSKYLICLSFLTPLFVNEKYNVFYSAFYPVIFSFSVGYVYLIIESIFFLFKNEQKTTTNFKSITKKIPYLIYSFLSNLLFVFFINKLMLKIFGNIYDNYYYFFVFICVVLLNYFNKIKIEIVKICIVLLSTTCLIIFKEIIELNLISFVVVLVYYSLNNFISNYNYKQIDINKLEEGMILSSNSVIILSAYNFENLPSDVSESTKAKLTKDNIKAIDKISKIIKITKLNIVRKLPFASFISVAYLLFVLGGSLL